MLGQPPCCEGFSVLALVGTSWFTEKAPLQQEGVGVGVGVRELRSGGGGYVCVWGGGGGCGGTGQHGSGLAPACRGGKQRAGEACVHACLETHVARTPDPPSHGRVGARPCDALVWCPLPAAGMSRGG